MLSRAVNFTATLYRVAVSPVFHWICGPGFGCRFVPSCSHYAQEAFIQHGLIRGAGLTIRRISRCHPFSPAGYDPVPRGIGKQQFK